MKTKFRGLALTAALLSGTSMTFADQGASSVVGDLPGYGEEAYFHEDGTYADSAYVAPASHAAYPGLRQAPSQYPPYPQQQPYQQQYTQQQYQPYQQQPYQQQPYQQQPYQPYAPVGAADLQTPYQQVGHHLDYIDGPSCDAAFAGGCDGACSGDKCGSCLGGCLSGCKGKQICGIFDCGYETWAQAEFLMWFTPNRDMPALVTTSAPGTFPTLPEGGSDMVEVAFGNQIQGELSGGYRGDYGIWVSKNIGLGGRFWILAENNDSYYAEGDGTGASIGIPFYNISTDSEDSVLINIDGNLAGGSTFGGVVAAESSLDMRGYEFYSRTRFSCTKSCRLEFLGGYSHFDIKDRLQIGSARINLANPATLRTRTFRDSFEADNDFNGGQLGFEMMITRGRWMARSMTKVHLGNMEQTYRISGVSTDDPDGPGASSPNITSGGILAQGNQGEFSRDVFAFAPEANFKLGYRFRKNVLLSVGYSFIYWDNVALNGDVVDRLISDPSQLNTGTFGNRPEFNFNDSSLWVQGIDLGVIIDI